VDSGSLVFLSGQLPFDADMKILASDIAGQTRQVIANIATVLHSMELTLADVVKTTVWITSAANFVEFDVAYAEGFGAHKPARSTVVSALVLPSALIEIEAIARRPLGSRDS
jgi:2-iminobutanoate/2-iminopropanoate deaminase